MSVMRTLPFRCSIGPTLGLMLRNSRDEMQIELAVARLVDPDRPTRR